MKALLVMLSLVATYAHADEFKGRDLQCRSWDSRGTIVTTLDVTGKRGEVRISYEGEVKSRTSLYIKGSSKNMIFETVHTGIAEQQVQVDVFAKSKFTLIVPDVLENSVTLVLNDMNTDEETDRVQFDCVRPDNR